jgi:DNA-binding IclR family transcriptional regulator
MYDVAVNVLKNDPFTERAMPLLERLRDSTRETVILGKRQGDNVIYLQVIEGLHSIRYSAKAGDHKPLHSSSIGKALLGSLKEADLREWMADKTFPAITPTTITDPEKLVHEILQSRRAGYFQTRGENVIDVWAVAAFLNVNKETLAVAVAGPKHRLENNLPECAHLLVATCSFLSRQLNG